MIKVMVAVSGGLDSAVLAHWAVNEYGTDNVALAYVDYGGVTAKTDDLAVRRLKNTLRCKYYPIYAKLPDEVTEKYYIFSKAMAKTERKRRVGGAPGMTVDHDRFLESYVPGLYMLVWNLIGALAAAELYDLILIGSNKYPRDISRQINCNLMDTAIPFLTFLNELGDVLWGPNKATIEQPFADMLKEEIVSLGRDLRVDMESTNSCDIYPPCGVCFECQQRESALKGDLT